MGAGLLECVLCLISQFDHPASCLCLNMWPLSLLRWLPVAIMDFPSEPINQNELFLPSFWPLCCYKSNQYTLLRSVVLFFICWYKLTVYTTLNLSLSCLWAGICRHEDHPAMATFSAKKTACLLSLILVTGGVLTLPSHIYPSLDLIFLEIIFSSNLKPLPIGSSLVYKLNQFIYFVRSF